jgi:hypothetical protein
MFKIKKDGNNSTAKKAVISKHPLYTASLTSCSWKLNYQRIRIDNILILNVNGNIIKSIPVTNEDFDVRKEGAIVFSLLDDHLIALQYVYTDEASDRKKHVTV